MISVNLNHYAQHHNNSLISQNNMKKYVKSAKILSYLTQKKNDKLFKLIEKKNC